MRLLLVEDDQKIAEFIVTGMKEIGFCIDHISNGEDAFDMARIISYDAAIIDIMLPKLNGLDLIERLRGEGIDVPVIILSAKQTADDRIRGLQRGGDDYLVKPFVFAELVARIQALIRRSSRVTEPSRLTFSDITVDLLKHEVTRAGSKIDLQPREFSLLEYLIRNAEKIVSKSMILEHIWDFQFDPQTNVVDVLICRLRNKLDKGFSKKLIHTIRGIGYVFKESRNND